MYSISFFCLLCYFVMRNHYLNKVHVPTDVCVAWLARPRLAITTDEESLTGEAHDDLFSTTLRSKHFSCLNMKMSNKGQETWKHFRSCVSFCVYIWGLDRVSCRLRFTRLFTWTCCSLLRAVKEIVLRRSLFAWIVFFLFLLLYRLTPLCESKVVTPCV